MRTGKSRRSNGLFIAPAAVRPEAAARSSAVLSRPLFTADCYPRIVLSTADFIIRLIIGAARPRFDYRNWFLLRLFSADASLELRPVAAFYWSDAFFMNRPREISALFNLQSIPETLELTESKDTTTVRLFVGLIKTHELHFPFSIFFPHKQR